MGKQVNDNSMPKGFFRLKITEGEDGKVVSDSGWKENQVTDLGVRDYIIDWLVGDTANGKSVSHIALGTGGAPAAGDTSLGGEVDKRAGASTSIVSSRTAQFTAQFASSNSFVTTTQNIANVGLFNTSSGGTIFAGNTYSSSSCATNQNVNCTYQIQFPT